MPLTTAITAEPNVEPVSLSDLKAHCRVDISADDDYLTALITVARQYCEKQTARSFITQTRTLSLDHFPHDGSAIELPYGPVQSITSIGYTDTDNESATWTASLYQSDLTSLVARIAPVWGEVYPSTYDVFNAVVVTYDAGYGDAASNVPGPIKQAIKLLAAHLYAHREPAIVGVSISAVPMTVDSLLGFYVDPTLY